MIRRVVVAPHADDESLGCGGLLAKYGSESAVVVMTRPTPTRAEEFARAMRVLNVQDTYVLDFPDTDLFCCMAEAVRKLDVILAELRPIEVYLPHPSMHQDHMAAYEAGMRACRLSMTAGHWFPPEVFIYDVAAYDMTLYETGFRWNVFEELTSAQVWAKQQACDCYLSENPGGNHPLNSVGEMVAAVGKPRGVEFAEQFALARLVRR